MSLGMMLPRSIAAGSRILLAICLAAAVAGCGPRQQTAAAVDADQARRTLQSVLESWRQGKTPESWREASPEVVVQDLDWTGGARLESFEILGSGKAQDANLFCQVKLVLRPAGGRPAEERTVTYVVGTDPVLTVFRDMMQ